MLIGLVVIGVVLTSASGAPAALSVSKGDKDITFTSSKMFTFTANYPLCVSGIGTNEEVVFTQTKMIRVYYYPTAVYCVNSMCKVGTDW